MVSTSMNLETIQMVRFGFAVLAIIEQLLKFTLIFNF
jgi:hypothetical protein